MALRDKETEGARIFETGALAQKGDAFLPQRRRGAAPSLGLVPRVRPGGRHRGRANARLRALLERVVTNVIHYAYAGRGEHEIRVTLEREGEEIRATVEDDGRPFNPLEKEPPAIPASLEDAGVGGWGIPIVRALADDLSYERRDGRNRFTIVSREDRSTKPE